jgi:mRNA-degrading endonuclease RelE of RelBE toxin-antitoxin system
MSPPNHWLQRGVGWLLLVSMLGVNGPAFAGNCADLADEAESQLAAAKDREEFQNVVALAQRALASGRGTACGAQANVILRDAQKELKKLDDADRKAADAQSKADDEKAKADADAKKKASADAKVKLKASQKIDVLDFRLAFEEGATPRDDVMAMVDGRVVPLGYSDLVSSGAHELVISPPPPDKKRSFELEVLIDRKKLEPSSRTPTEYVYTFDSKKGANLMMLVKLIRVEPDASAKPEKKPFPWHTVAVVSGAALLLGGGGVGLWHYYKYENREERRVGYLERYCEEGLDTFSCEGAPTGTEELIEKVQNERDDNGRIATIGAIVGVVGVGLIVLGLFVLQPPSDSSKGAAKGAGRGAVNAAPKPGLSEAPTVNIIPVLDPNNAGLFLRGTF